MVITSRRAFVKGAAAACLGLANIETRGFDGGGTAGLPNPVFAYEFGDISPAQQAGFAREYGFEGTVFDHAQQMPERLRALDEAHLQLFFLWLTVDISNGQIKYEPGMEAAIEALQGRGTVVWAAVQGGDAEGGTGAEERAIQAVDRISDLASRSNLRAALYPHYGFYLARFRDVVRVAERVRRSNVGVTFNLCHELCSGFDPQFNHYWIALCYAFMASRSMEQTGRAGIGTRSFNLSAAATTMSRSWSGQSPKPGTAGLSVSNATD